MSTDSTEADTWGPYMIEYGLGNEKRITPGGQYESQKDSWNVWTAKASEHAASDSAGQLSPEDVVRSLPASELPAFREWVAHLLLSARTVGMLMSTAIVAAADSEASMETRLTLVEDTGKRVVKHAHNARLAHATLIVVDRHLRIIEQRAMQEGAPS